MPNNLVFCVYDADFITHGDAVDVFATEGEALAHLRELQSWNTGSEHDAHHIMQQRLADAPLGVIWRNPSGDADVAAVLDRWGVIADLPVEAF